MELEIKDWQKGIGTSPETGFQEMTNVDINTPGVVELSFKNRNIVPSSLTRTFTADASTDLIAFSAVSNSDYVNARAVQFTTTGTLPAGLSTGTIYWLVATDSTHASVSSTYGLARKSPVTKIDITDTGSGTHTLISVDMGTPIASTKDGRTGYYYVLCVGGQVWTDRTGVFQLLHKFVEDSGNTFIDGNDINIFKDYLMLAGNTAIRWWGPLASAEDVQAYEAGSLGLTSGVPHQTVLGGDDIMYITDGAKISSVGQKLGQTFTPASSATYNWNVALDFQTGTVLRTIAELGKFLAIGIDGFIYKWDRISSSFNIPLKINGDMIAMEAYNNLLYFMCGTNPDIYVTDGTNVSLVKEFPRFLLDRNGFGVASVKRDAFTIKDNRIYFGLNLVNLIGTQYTNYTGVWVYDIATGRLHKERSISPTFTVVTSTQTIYALQDDLTLWGQTGTGASTGIDSISDHYKNDGYTGKIITPLYPIGTGINASKFSHIDLFLEKAIDAGVDGQGIRLGYRADALSDFTTIATIDDTTHPGQSVIAIPYALNAPQVQFQIELTSPASSVYSPRITSIKIYD